MRYGILSDIHGNLEALEAVLEVLRQQDLSAFLCLGDIVGYGADPNPCCERVRALPGLRAVVGNHDAAALGSLDTRWFNALAREAVEWTAGQLSPDNRAFLASLPETDRGDGFQIVHGSLAQPVTGYLMDAFSAMESLDAQLEPVCFVGHTHLPAAYARPRGGMLGAAISFSAWLPLVLAPDREYVLNCGSVGQPRDGDRRAACGVYDSEAGTVTRMRVSYPVEAAQAKIRAAGLPAWLADRLEEGR